LLYDPLRIKSLGLTSCRPAFRRRVSFKFPFSSRAFMLIKKISGKRHPFPHFSAEKINHRPVGDFSDKVQARYLHGTEDVDKLSLVPGSIPPQRGGLGTKIMFQFLL